MIDKEKIFKVGLSLLVCAALCLILAIIVDGTDALLSFILSAGLALFGLWLLWESYKKEPEGRNKYRTGTPCSNSNAADQNRSHTTSSVEYVFISKSGKKYHKDPYCGGNQNLQRVSKTDAVLKGCTQCNRCFFYDTWSRF